MTEKHDEKVLKKKKHHSTADVRQIFTPAHR